MTTPCNPERREALKKIITGGAALAAGAAFMSHERSVLAQHLGVQDLEVDALSGASRTHTDWTKFEALKKPMVRKTIKGLDISQMFFGGNLVGGWAHARDLLYVDALVVAYHTRDKIFATFELGEACGINAYLGHHSHIGIMVDYWTSPASSYGRNMRYIADCSSIDAAIECLDKGASAAYMQGEMSDRLVREGRFDEIAAFADRMRNERAVWGLGAHRLETVKACVEQGYNPDFWMKTIHHGNYWSRMPNHHEHDNVWCRDPDGTIAFMNALPQPWIGFKVLAAGAIHPHDGFRYAFESGADFICVGMYDFQVVDNVNTCMDILDSSINRRRPWRFT